MCLTESSIYLKFSGDSFLTMFADALSNIDPRIRYINTKWGYCINMSNKTSKNAGCGRDKEAPSPTCLHSEDDTGSKASRSSSVVSVVESVVSISSHPTLVKKNMNTKISCVLISKRSSLCAFFSRRTPSPGTSKSNRLTIEGMIKLWSR